MPYIEPRELERRIVGEVLKVLGMSPTGVFGRALTPILCRAVQRFAEVAATCDRLMAQQGFVASSRWTLSQFAEGPQVAGAERIPRAGPLLIAANHPGTVDALVIIVGAGREDLKIIAGPMPFLQYLPNVSQHLLFSPGDDVQRRARVLREAIRHLAQGGALLLFARGQLDPDPATMRGAEAELAHWSRSIELFLRSVPEATVVPAIVSGVLARRSVRHPLTWIRRRRLPRQRLAMILQFVQQMRGKRISLVPRVTFGEPLSGPALVDDPLSAVIASARELLARHVGCTGHGHASPSPTAREARGAC